MVEDTKIKNEKSNGVWKTNSLEQKKAYNKLISEKQITKIKVLGLRKIKIKKL